MSAPVEISSDTPTDHARRPVTPGASGPDTSDATTWASFVGASLRPFWERRVRFSINTDGPYLLDTNMRSEVRLVRDSGILSEEQIDETLRWAREASFVEAEPSAGSDGSVRPQPGEGPAGAARGPG